MTLKPIGRRRRRRETFKNTTTPKARTPKSTKSTALSIITSKTIFFSLSPFCCCCCCCCSYCANRVYLLYFGETTYLSRGLSTARARSANPSKFVVKRIVVFSLRHLLLGPMCGFCFCAASSRRRRRWTRGHSLKISAPSSNLPIRKSRRF